MSRPETRLLATAATAVLAMAGLDAQAADLRGERYALVDPAAMQRLVPVRPTSTAKAPLAGTTRKKARQEKSTILTGLQNFRTTARQALERISGHTACQTAEQGCPTVFREGVAKSQSWRYATTSSPREVNHQSADVARPDAGQPALERPFADVPGLVPGRESNYKLTLNMPLGQYENVLLQARLRRNAYNTDDTSDSTLRADWSLRF